MFTILSTLSQKLFVPHANTDYRLRVLIFNLQEINGKLIATYGKQWAYINAVIRENSFTEFLLLQMFQRRSLFINTRKLK